MATETAQLIDDRSTLNLDASTGNRWRLVTDEVMGGRSSGSIDTDNIEGRPCLRMRGEVSLENSGGFIQMALDIPQPILVSITEYKGLELDVYGNAEQYNIHLRSDDIYLPWQSYRVSFMATPQWQTLQVPFTRFQPHRIEQPLDIAKLRRIGLIAIGRAFDADLCIARVALYK